MGYRLRLGKIAKTVREKYKGMTEEQLDEISRENNYSHTWYYPKEHTQLYEMGKYLNFGDELEHFYDFEGHDNEFKIMTKEQLLKVIEWYRNEIYDYYTNADEQEQKAHFRKMEIEWSGKYTLPYYLDEPDERKDGAIVRSWQLQYAIFNIVYIYQHFDWENDYLIYSGW